MRVALFVTCFNDTLFPHAGRATVEILERVGCQVEFPLEQTCCGQMHVNSGYEHAAVGLMERFARALAGKLRHILDSRAEVCTAADTSCLMHIGGALRRQRAGVRTMHLAEILAATE